MLSLVCLPPSSVCLSVVIPIDLSFTTQNQNQNQALKQKHTILQQTYLLIYILLVLATIVLAGSVVTSFILAVTRRSRSRIRRSDREFAADVSYTATTTTTTVYQLLITTTARKMKDDGYGYLSSSSCLFQ